MGLFGQYVFRTTLGAFFLVLISLTGVIWITQALREIDVMTSQRQTVLVFLKMTSLIIPQLIVLIAPIALTIAIGYVLNKLANDSELIVINAAGMPPWPLFRVFVVVAIIVAMIVAVIAFYFAPKSYRELARIAMQVRADLVSNIIQPGQFTPIENGLTFHIRERRPDGILLGVLVDDRREPSEQSTIIAEQGDILQNETGSFLLLQRGNVQRLRADERDPTIIEFDRYAIDLSQFTTTPQTIISYKPSQRYIWELMSPPKDDPTYQRAPGKFRSELDDRIAAPLYPIIFTVIMYVFLGAPRTNRQNRGASIAMAIAAAATIRLIGFANGLIGQSGPIGFSGQYILMVLVIGFGLVAISRGTIIEPPAIVTTLIARVTERFSRQLASA